MDTLITRAKNLVLNGRFQNHVTKRSDRFNKIPTNEFVKIGTTRYVPYYDEKTKQVVFGYEEEGKLHYVAFSNHDWHFGSQGDFEWFDA